MKRRPFWGCVGVVVAGVALALWFAMGAIREMPLSADLDDLDAGDTAVEGYDPAPDPPSPAPDPSPKPIPPPAPDPAPPDIDPEPDPGPGDRHEASRDGESEEMEGPDEVVREAESEEMEGPDEVPREVENGDGAEPVYNAVFEPSLSSSPLTFEDLKPVTATFFIDERDRRSVLGAELQTPSAELLAATADLRLIVTMVCSFCDGEEQVRSVPITYFAAPQRSEIATFEFTPRSALAREGGAGSIVLQVLGPEGVQFDTLALPAFVVGRGESVASDEETLEPRRFDTPPNEPGVDLVLQVYRDSEENTRVIVIPTLRALSEALRGTYLDRASGYRSFDAGRLPPNELLLRTRETYKNLRLLVERGSSNLAALKDGPDAPVELSSEFLFNDEDRSKLVNRIGELGKPLFRELFLDGEDELSRVMQVISGFTLPDRRLRVRIQTRDFHLPWQLLHPPEPIEAGKFWGFRYDLVVDSLDIARDGRVGGKMVPPSAEQQVVIARWRGTSDTDQQELSQSALRQVEKIRALFGGARDSTSHRDFLDTLSRQRAQVRLIYAYLHAESGTSVQGGLAATSVTGPRLMFARDDYLGPLDLKDRLEADLGWDDELSFPREPIVILNACETGAGGFEPTTNFHFPGIFLHLGARSVIATEAPVDSSFASLFGTKLLEAIADGEGLAEAVTDLRLRFLEKSNSPMGLLYSYYGSPAARVEPE